MIEGVGTQYAVDLLAIGGILPATEGRRPWGTPLPGYVTGAVLARRSTKMLGTQSEHDNIERAFQPRARPAKLPTGMLTLYPFSGVHADEPWLLVRRRQGGLREGKRM